MALSFVLRRNNIRSHKAYGRWYAHTVRSGEMTMEEIERRIQDCCTLTRADVRAVIAALQDVVNDALHDGMVVNLNELGKLRLSLRGKSVDDPADFDISKHITGVACKYTPQGHRTGLDKRRLERQFTSGCVAQQMDLVDETGKNVTRMRRRAKV